MSRFRWYHYYFLLAFFDVVVIGLSLQLHQQAVNRVARLVDAEKRLDEETYWLSKTQEAVMELNAPGNDLFGSEARENYELQQRRFVKAQQNMDAALRGMREAGLDATRFSAQVRNMTDKAQALFDVLQPRADGAVTQSLDSASKSGGPIMRDMDRAQHDALGEIALIANKNAQRRFDLIQEQQAEIEGQFVKQRYIIAGVLLILVGVLFFGRQLQQADRALNIERERVKEAKRERLAAIGELCSSVAHGIRNPLAAIRSSAQLALELGQFDTGTRERIQDILDEGRRLGDRVTGLLSMARVNADTFGEIDLRNVVNVGVKGLLPELERRGLILETEISDKPVLVSGDRPRLEQCVVEYLSNAMEHSPDGGTIRVSCLRENDDALIAVEDEGPGVPRAVRDRVFDLFFTTKPAGTGIGLATVKRIAKLHGGDANLADVSAGGARFTITIPRSVEGARKPSRGGQAAA